MSERNTSGRSDHRTAGVDEAGRGPLAGPVVAAAVVLSEPIAGLADSKALSPARRVELAELIRERAVAWSVAWADRSEIDSLNILHATMLAMRRAVLGIHVRVDRVLVDGNRLPDLAFNGRQLNGEAIVKGDTKVACISAASILAKTVRDSIMLDNHRLYPNYGFDAHKGYPTAAHLSALEEIGPCPQHRRSFAPVRNAIDLALA